MKWILFTYFDINWYEWKQKKAYFININAKNNPFASQLLYPHNWGICSLPGQGALPKTTLLHDPSPMIVLKLPPLCRP